MGLDVANASLLDEATSTAEAMHLACRSVPATDDGSPSASAMLGFICSPELHLLTLIVVQTRADGLGVRILEADPAAVTIQGHPPCDMRLLLLQCHDTCAARTPSAPLRMRQARSWSWLQTCLSACLLASQTQ